jgi:signal transduction histidine kinase
MTRSTFGHLPPRTLDAIHEAALTITSELSLPVVLNRVVTIARDLVQARYAALGIPDPTGSNIVQFITSGMTPEEEHAIGNLPVGRGLLGELLEPDARPIRIASIADDPRSVGFPPNHPPMTSFLGVPLRLRGKLLGNLYLTDKMGEDAFTEDDQKIIETLAGYAAVAIENAQLYQQVQRLAVLEERDRIGMDLHDGIIQSIYAVGLTLEHVQYLLNENPPGAEERLDEAIKGLNLIIKDIRNYILDLRPERFEGTNLAAALDRLAREFQANTLADVDVSYDGKLSGQLDEKSAAAAFHIVQEALANAAKHAAATHLSVIVARMGPEVVIGIRDNGRGFDEDKPQERLGHGLSNMQLRARSVGGRLKVRSRPGEGTLVTAYLPLNHRGEDGTA